MADPGSMEKYCSSYYDKHGLYNDGFPCPDDKYCCQNSDGTKMCCQISTAHSTTFSTKLNKIKLASSTRHQSDIILNTLSNNQKNSNLFEPAINKRGPSSVAVASSALPYLFSNTNLLIALIVSLTILLLITILILICVCRAYCCDSRKKKTSKTSLKYSVENNNQLGCNLLLDHQSNHHDRNHSRHNTLNKKSNIDSIRSSKKLHSSSSRDSTTSSCNSTTITTSTSSSHSSSSSPKTNEVISVCVDNNQNNANSMISQRQSDCTSFIVDSLNLRSAATSTTNNGIYSNLNSYINAMSSGSAASTCALLLNNSNLNLTTTNLSTTQSNNMNIINNNLNDLISSNFDENDELGQQVLEEEEDEDFIVSTSSNLEFLKSHSLFAQTTPLNYYPSLALNKSNKMTNTNSPLNSKLLNKQTSLAASVSLQSPASTVNQITPNSNNKATNANTNNLIDFRFSTFLPPPSIQIIKNNSASNANNEFV